LQPLTFAVLVAAALLHATWNALVSRGSDRRSTLILLVWVEGALALCALPFVAWPTRAAWLWLLLGTVLRVGALLLLLRAYGLAAFSRVYPIARGASPLLMGLFGTLVLDDHLPVRAICALLAVALGVLLIARVDRRPAPDAAALQAGIATAILIAAYSTVDARGVRASPDPLGYAAFGFVGEALGMAMYAFATRGKAVLGETARAWRTGIPAGVMSTCSYLVALWAFSRAPVALVGSIRETSVLFALLIAAFVLHEKLTSRDWIAAVLIVGGAVAARF